MWRSIRTYSALFSSAVVSAVDTDGYPCSTRCVPALDDTAQVIRFHLAGDASHAEGPANLLFHKHNDQLWDLKIFQVTGTLERAGDGWVFRPQRLIPGNGINAWNDLKTIVNARRTARQYMAKRARPLPRIPWDRIRSLYP